VLKKSIKRAVDRFKALIGAYLKSNIDNGRNRTIREFVSKFRGLSGTAKQKAVTEEKDQVASLLAMAIETDDQRKEREERLKLLRKLTDRKLAEIEVRKRPVLTLIGRNARAVRSAEPGSKVTLRVHGVVMGVGTKGQKTEATIQVDRVTK